MEVIGYSTRELIDAMADAGIHCSLDRFRRLAIALQSAALAQLIAVDGKEQALQRMHENEVELGLDGEVRK
jgi:alpha-D-ribose 1-methylphosphonate 5-triphosphate synthase subunit PhnH